MTFEDLMPMLMPAAFAFCLILERLMPAREQPHVRFWLLKGIVFFLLVGAINAIVPALVMQQIGDYSVLHLASFGTLAGVLLVVVLSDLAGYWIHRGLHTSQLVWRFTHQMHHAPERMDMGGSAFFHPFDVFAQQIVPTVLITVLLGVTPLAAAIAGFIGFLLGVTPHLNVRTPAWLGYVFQRPEMHAVHHTRGVHAYNYGVLAWSDMLFGTWRNPVEFPDGEFGFWDGASGKVGRMLIGGDVTRGGVFQTGA